MVHYCIVATACTIASSLVARIVSHPRSTPRARHYKLQPLDGFVVQCDSVLWICWLYMITVPCTIWEFNDTCTEKLLLCCCKFLDHFSFCYYTPWPIKKRATLFWTITSAFLDGFQHFGYQQKRNKYSTLCFTSLVVRYRLWRHNCVTLHVMNVYCANEW